MHYMKYTDQFKFSSAATGRLRAQGGGHPGEIMMAWFCAIRVGFPEEVTWEVSLSPKFWDERAVGVHRRSRVRRP